MTDYDPHHPHLAEREVLVKAPHGAYGWAPCRVVNQRPGEGRLRVEFAPYDQGYKLWVASPYVRPRQTHADSPTWPPNLTAADDTETHV